MKNNLAQIIQPLTPEDRWTSDEHAEMALLVIVHSMSPEGKKEFLSELGIAPKEYEYLTEKYSRPLAKLQPVPI